MERVTDKTKRKNWIDGDTFAIKIKNCSDEYNDRYLILNKCVYEIWKKNFKTEEEFEKHMRNTPSFYIKITNGKEIPNTYEELNKLEFIKMLDIYTDDSTVNKFDKGLYSNADDFNYTYEYLNQILFHRGFDFKEFIYIGNYKFDCPKNEFIPYFWVEVEMVSTKFEWIKTLIDKYENYNLRKSSHFTPEGQKRFVETYKGNINFIEEVLVETKSKVKEIERIYLYGIGPKLYESDVALDIKADYKKYLRTSKKSNQSNEEMIKELCDYYEDYINDSIDGPLFWIILSDLQMKNKTLTKKQKKKALEEIEQDLVNWKDKEGYSQRKEELDLLKEELENYIFK